MADPLIKFSDLRVIGYCVSGAKLFATRYGLDWSKFVREGYMASELLRKTDNNAMIERAIKLITQRR